MTSKLREIIAYRELLLNFVSRDLKARYKGSILGFLWSFLNPLLMMLVFVLVFGHVAKLGWRAGPIFYLTGIFPWNFFAGCVSEGTICIVANGGLLRKAYFPKEVIPLSIVTSNLVHFVAGLLILTPYLILFKTVTLHLLPLLPALIVIQAGFALGVTLILSALYVFYRDVAHLVQILLLLWFFGSGIFFPLSLVPERYLGIFLLNPMAALIGGYRQILFEAQMPNWSFLICPVLLTVVALAVGYQLYRKYGSYFVEAT